MDNIVIDAKEDGSETAVLLDLEQGRNIYNWPPLRDLLRGVDSETWVARSNEI